MSYNLDTLKAAVKTYLESTESQFVAQMDNFIRNAEDRIFGLVQMRAQEATISASTSNGQGQITLPTNFIGLVSFALVNPVDSEYCFCELKEPSFLKTYQPEITTLGKPKYCAIDNGLLLFIPAISNSTYTSSVLEYITQPTSLTELSGTDMTQISENYPDLLLYATLVEGATFLKETPDVIANFGARFQEAIARAKNLSEGQGTRSRYRYGQVRTNPTQVKKNGDNLSNLHQL